MKSVRITRKVDELGRIVIPAEIRKHLDVEPGTDLEVELRGEEIVVKRTENCCRICGATDNLITVDDTFVCEDCARIISKALGN